LYVLSFVLSPTRPDSLSFPTRRSSDLRLAQLRAIARDDECLQALAELLVGDAHDGRLLDSGVIGEQVLDLPREDVLAAADDHLIDRKSTRLNSSHVEISYAVFCLKKKK